MSASRSRQSSDDEDLEEHSAIRQAMPVSKTKADLVNGIPVSGEDYILLVQQQRKKCAKTMVGPSPPHIVKQSLPATYLFNTDTSAPSPGLLPSSEWQNRFAVSFETMQKAKQNSKLPIDESKKLTKTKEEWYQTLYGNEPGIDNASLSRVESMPQRIIIKLLLLHNEWLTDFKDAMLPWIYALLVYLDPVLTSQDISVLRDLARTCISLRNKKQESDDQVARLNIIITIIAKVFRQSDLV